MSTADPFDLERFVAAQAPVYAQVCLELERGRKTSHWMWFVFPQLKALGRSATAQQYGISGRDEALAYWHHEVLGARLRHCTALVLQVKGRTLHEIFGSPDDLKFVSCMTLFGAIAPEERRSRARSSAWPAAAPMRARSTCSSLDVPGRARRRDHVRVRSG